MSTSIAPTIDQTTVRAVLDAAMRAPSAHNAQPWRLRPLTATSWELHYDHHDYLPDDPDDRDAYLALGGFVETMALAAEASELALDWIPRFERLPGGGLYAGTIALVASPGPCDPLAIAVGMRHTNRHPYRRGIALPAALHTALAAEGCVEVEPGILVPAVRRAGILSWRDRRFVTDLRRWTRFGQPDAADGMTIPCLALPRSDRLGLRYAFSRGRLGRVLARVWATRDVRLLRACSTCFVVPAPSLAPADLFAAGRRLVRAWVAVCAAGWAYTPISIAIDRPETRPAIARAAHLGDGEAVALFRVGLTAKPVPWSSRRSVDAVLNAPM